jgi:hypothetical protein
MTGDSRQAEPSPLRRRNFLWALVPLSFLVMQLRPLFGRWDRTVLGSLDGVDALLQSGILTWTARHFWQPLTCIDLPIFHPARSALVCMDTLVGQAVMVAPLVWLGDPTPALLYNLAVVATLVLVAAAGAWLWLATSTGDDGPERAAGAALLALLLLGAPFTTWQLGMLNQISPPWVILLVAVLWCGWRRFERGEDPRRWWWLAAGCLVVQAAWGWYGFADAVFVLGTGLVMGAWRAWRRGRLRPLVVPAILPGLVAALLVLGLAWPYLQLRADTPAYTRELNEVQHYGAHLHVLTNAGPHRLGWSDLTGAAEPAAERARRNVDAVMHPGWLALAGVVLGVVTWRRWSGGRRRAGLFLAIVGVVGFVMAFGDSVGVPPGSDRRIILPFGVLREIVTAFEAYRAPARFLFLTVIATSWWATAGIVTAGRGRRWLVPLAMALIWLESIPMAMLAVPVEVDGRQDPTSVVRDAPAGAVLTLPAPRSEAEEDAAETRWLHRALATGRAVTGGVSGWVPPATRQLREALAASERGELAPAQLLADVRAMGVSAAEIRIDGSDPDRVAFWRRALADLGAAGRPSAPGFEFYVLPADSAAASAAH